MVSNPKNYKSAEDKQSFVYNQQIISDRFQLRHSGTYSSHFLPNAKYNKETVFVLGNNVHIRGFVDDDYNSNDNLLNELEQKNPNVIFDLNNIIGYDSWRNIFIRYGVLQKRPS